MDIQDEELLARLGEAQHRQGRLHEAQKSYRQALAHNEKNRYECMDKRLDKGASKNDPTPPALVHTYLSLSCPAPPSRHNHPPPTAALPCGSACRCTTPGTRSMRATTTIGPSSWTGGTRRPTTISVGPVCRRHTVVEAWERAR